MARPVVIWNDDRKERLREMYPSKTNKEIAMYMNTTVGNIEQVANKLQLRKDKSHITKVRRSNVNKRHNEEVK